MAILRALRRQQQFGDNEVEFDGGVEFVCFGAEQSVQVEFGIVYVLVVKKTSRRKCFKRNAKLLPGILKDQNPLNR